MYSVPPAGPAWHAVGARLERGVRHCGVDYRQICRRCHGQNANDIVGALTWRGGSLSSCIGVFRRGGPSCKQELCAFVSKELMRGHSRSWTPGLRCVFRGGAGAEHGTDCMQNQNACRSPRLVLTVWVALVFKDDRGEKSQHEWTGGRFWRCLTFELSGRRRQDARARAEKMYRVPQAGRWWSAVGAPLERGVRRHFRSVVRECTCPPLNVITDTTES